MLDPFTGQFISVDLPIGFDSGSWNPYGYVGNNPVTVTDPNGLQGSAPIIGVGSGTTCPGADALAYLLQQLSKAPNKDCIPSILRVCSNGAATGLLALIKEAALATYISQTPCPLISDPRAHCATEMHGQPQSSKPWCNSGSICFDSTLCASTVGDRAGGLLFELMNYCNCKYHRDYGFEGPAADVSGACSRGPV